MVEKSKRIKYGLNMYGSYRIYSAFVEWDRFTEKERKKRGYNHRYAYVNKYVREIDNDSNIEHTLKQNIFDVRKYPKRKKYEELGNGLIISLTKQQFFSILNKFEKNVKILTMEEKERKRKAKIERKKKEKKRIVELIEKAKLTGKKQVINSYPIECQDPREECDIDIVTIYIDKNGKKSKTITHTW